MSTFDYLADLDEDSLAQIISDMSEAAKQATRAEGMARMELTRRLQERGATRFDSEHWTGTVMAGAWEIVDEQPLVNAGLAEKCFIIPVPKPQIGKWDNRALNEMHKRGGTIAEAIDASRRRGEGMLVLERKKELPDAV